jgi:hypothetical protein
MAMTAEDFRAALARLGMPQVGTADNGADSFLGVGERTVRRWASGEVEVPDSVEMLLRIMTAHKWRPERVRLRYCKGPARARRSDDPD